MKKYVALVVTATASVEPPPVLAWNEIDNKGDGSLYIKDCVDFNKCKKKIENEFMPQLREAQSNGYKHFMTPGFARLPPYGTEGKVGYVKKLPWEKKQQIEDTPIAINWLNGCCAVEGCVESIKYLNWHVYEEFGLGKQFAKGSESNPVQRANVERTTKSWEDAGYGRVYNAWKKVMDAFSNAQANLDGVPEEVKPHCHNYQFEGMWVSEVGFRGSNVKPHPKQEFSNEYSMEHNTKEYMKAAVPYLLEKNDIKGVNWYTYDTGMNKKYLNDNKLFERTGQLTQLGETYKGLCQGNKKCGFCLKGDDISADQSVRDTVLQTALESNMHHYYTWDLENHGWNIKKFAEKGLMYMPMYFAPSSRGIPEYPGVTTPAPTTAPTATQNCTPPRRPPTAIWKKSTNVDCKTNWKCDQKDILPESNHSNWKQDGHCCHHKLVVDDAHSAYWVSAFGYVSDGKPGNHHVLKGTFKKVYWPKEDNHHYDCTDGFMGTKNIESTSCYHTTVGRPMEIDETQWEKCAFNGGTCTCDKTVKYGYKTQKHYEGVYYPEYVVTAIWNFAPKGTYQCNSSTFKFHTDEEFDMNDGDLPDCYCYVGKKESRRLESIQQRQDLDHIPAKDAPEVKDGIQDLLDAVSA